jgi:hypothetical protein
MFGILGNPMVTVMWFLEQVDVHVFGSTARSSDSRIVLSFSINSGIIIGMYFLGYEAGRIKDAIILGVVLAWVFSHNALFSIGMVRPFMIVNEKLQQQKEYSDIVFSHVPELAD